MPTLSAESDPAESNYHATWLAHSQRSAAFVVPRILKLLGPVESVVDFGCGAGAWLQAFRLGGASRLLGLDRADVPEPLMQISTEERRRLDLENSIPPLGDFDLAMSLEVADSLTQDRAEPLVRALTDTSAVVVFGAAIPGQWHAPNPNEQWASYWAALFAAAGYDCFDVLREPLWYDHRVDWWYAQNTLVFVRRSCAELTSRLSPAARPGALDVVHPRAFETYRSQIQTHQITASDAPNTSGDLDLYPFSMVEEGFLGCNILQIATAKYLALGQCEGTYSPQRLADGGYRHAYVGTTEAEAKAKIPFKLVEEGYAGHNILQVGPGAFLALAQREGAYAPEKLAAGGYAEAYLGASVEEVRAQIPLRFRRVLPRALARRVARKLKRLIRPESRPN